MEPSDTLGSTKDINNNNTNNNVNNIQTTDQNNNQRDRLRRKSFEMYSCKILCFATLIHQLAFTLLVSASMGLPDGIENILGFVPSSNFQCERDGYFGDIDNDCRIFHLCQKHVHPSGRTEWRHWTYACGNQTMFNQLTLTCAFVDEAIPCRHASQFQYLNEVIHRPREPFLTDADVTSGFSYYSNRIMSDGARARAFEDSNLLAQLGGASHMTASSQPISHQQPSFRSLEEGSMGDHNSISQPEFPLSPSFQSALGHSFNQLHRHPSETFESKPHHFQHFQFTSSNNVDINQLLGSMRREQPPQASDSELSPVASNMPEATSTITERSNQPATMATPESQPQGQQVPTEAFNFAVTTNHQIDADSPIVSVHHSTGTHAFSFPPPAPPSPITTSLPELTTLPPRPTTTTISLVDDRPKQALPTTTGSTLASSEAERPTEQASRQFTATPTTTQPSLTTTQEAPSTASAIQTNRSKLVDSSTPKLRNFSSRQTHRRRHNSGQFESFRLSANTTQNRQQSSTQASSIVLRRSLLEPTGDSRMPVSLLQPLVGLIGRRRV